jgi:hypothetical protein
MGAHGHCGGDAAVQNFEEDPVPARCRAGAVLALLASAQPRAGGARRAGRGGRPGHRVSRSCMIRLAGSQDPPKISPRRRYRNPAPSSR